MKYKLLIFVALIFVVFTSCSKSPIPSNSTSSDISYKIFDYETINKEISEIDVLPYNKNKQAEMQIYNVENEIKDPKYKGFSIIKPFHHNIEMLISFEDSYQIANYSLTEKAGNRIEYIGDAFATSNTVIDVVQSNVGYISVELKQTEVNFTIEIRNISTDKIIMSFDTVTYPYYFSKDRWIVLSTNESNEKNSIEKIIAIDLDNINDSEPIIIHEKEYSGTNPENFEGEKLISLGLTDSNIIFQTWSNNNKLSIYERSLDAIKLLEPNLLTPVESNFYYSDVFYQNNIFIGNVYANDKPLEKSILFDNSKSQFILPVGGTASKITYIGDYNKKTSIVQIDASLYAVRENDIYKISQDEQIFFSEMYSDLIIGTNSDNVYCYVLDEPKYDELTYKYQEDLMLKMEIQMSHQFMKMKNICIIQKQVFTEKQLKWDHLGKVVIQ